MFLQMQCPRQVHAATDKTDAQVLGLAQYSLLWPFVLEDEVEIGGPITSESGVCQARARCHTLARQRVVNIQRI